MNTVTLNENPRIIRVDDFLTVEERDHLILHSTPGLRSSEVIDPESGEGTVNEYRTGMNFCFNKGQDLVIKAIEEKIAKVCGVKYNQLENIQVNKYEVGNEFKPHQDWLEEKSAGHQRQIAQGGQRLITCIVYLKVPEEGGETNFEYLNIQVKPQERSALIWFNVKQRKNGDGDVEVDHRLMHAGLPVTKGEKWILTCWIRERASDGSEEAAHRAKKAQAAESKQALESKLKELRKKNRVEGQAEIMEICKRRNLVLTPSPFLTREGRIGAELYLLDPEHPEEVD